jgi:hypothetical protein
MGSPDLEDKTSGHNNAKLGKEKAAGDAVSEEKTAGRPRNWSIKRISGFLGLGGGADEGDPNCRGPK